MTRRNVLKSVGAGVSLSAITMFDDETARIGDHEFDPEEEVPYVAGWKNHFDGGNFVEKEPIYSSMSEDKWTNIRAGREAVNRIAESLACSEVEEEEFVFLKTADEDSEYGHRIKVAHLGDDLETREKAREWVPDVVDSEALDAGVSQQIPTEVVNADIDKQAAYDEPDGDYKLFDDVPGGAPVRARDGDGGSCCIAAPFYDNTHGRGWVGVQHGFMDTDGSPVGTEVSLLSGSEGNLYSTDERIGTIRDYWIEDRSSPQTSTEAPIDLAFIEDDQSDKSPHRWIAGSSYLDNDDLPVTTVIADVELENQEGNSSWNLKAQGQMTGRSDSYVDTIVYDGTGEVIGGLLDADYSENGDSGGPVFHELSGEAYICGIVVGEASPDNEWGYQTYFNTAQTVEEYLDGEWDAQ